MIRLGPDENVQRPQIAQNKTYLVDPEDSGGDACSEGGGQGGCDLSWCSYTPKLTEFQFYLGYVVATLSFPFCIGLCQAMFSKSLGGQPQGTWMGLLTSSGSLARILGPILGSYVYEDLGTFWLFGLCAGSLLLSAIVTGAAFRHLVPAQQDLESQQGEALPLTETPQRADQDISVENKTEEESKCLLDQLEDKLEGNTEKVKLQLKENAEDEN